jgi:hypothetical protein
MMMRSFFTGSPLLSRALAERADPAAGAGVG